MQSPITYQQLPDPPSARSDKEGTHWPAEALTLPRPSLSPCQTISSNKVNLFQCLTR